MSQYGNPAVAQAFWRSVPPRLRPLLQGAAIFYIAMLCIDIGTMIVSILALSGSYSEDEDPIVIKFPTLALHVQRLIVAWASVSLVASITLALMTSLGISPKAPSRNEREFAVARRRLLTYFVPWALASLAVWATCAGLQARYYVLDRASYIPTCRRYPELTQCWMVFATWILVLVYIAMHLLSLVWLGLLLSKMHIRHLQSRKGLTVERVQMFDTSQ
ncbi:hypothetical protein FJTKL_12109 [Diaporthe vaccinii]|uniref:G-protein coupled receptors family 1 profile domain-containing protein n=1 Tax=Diaporthe vaccinii TaxID=105482 RepID=A0ABR4EEU1_9PEZI